MNPASRAAPARRRLRLSAATLPSRPPSDAYQFSPVSQYGIRVTAAYWNPIMTTSRSGVQLRLEDQPHLGGHHRLRARPGVDFVFTNHLFSPGARRSAARKVFGRRHDAAAARPDRRAGRFAHRHRSAAAGKEVAFPGPEATIATKFTYAQLLARKIEVMPVFAGNMDGAFVQLFAGKAAAVGANSQPRRGATRGARARSSRCCGARRRWRPRADAFGAGAGRRCAGGGAMAFLGMHLDPRGATSSTPRQARRHRQRRVLRGLERLRIRRLPRLLPHGAAAAALMSTLLRRLARRVPVADLAGRARVSRSTRWRWSASSARGGAVHPLRVHDRPGQRPAPRRGLVLVMAPTDPRQRGDRRLRHGAEDAAARHPPPTSLGRVHRHARRPAARRRPRRRARRGAALAHRSGRGTAARRQPDHHAGGRDYGVLRMSYAPDAIAGPLWQQATWRSASACWRWWAARSASTCRSGAGSASLDRLQAFDREGALAAAEPMPRAEDAPLELRRTFETLRRAARSRENALAAALCAACSRACCRRPRPAPGRRRHRGDLAPDRRADHAAAGARRPARRDLRAQPRRLSSPSTPSTASTTSPLVHALSPAWAKHQLLRLGESS